MRAFRLAVLELPEAERVLPEAERLRVPRLLFANRGAVFVRVTSGREPVRELAELGRRVVPVPERVRLLFLDEDTPLVREAVVRPVPARVPVRSRRRPRAASREAEEERLTLDRVVLLREPRLDDERLGLVVVEREAEGLA